MSINRKKTNFDGLSYDSYYLCHMKKKSGFKGERAHVLPLPSIMFLKKHALSEGLYITDIGYYPHAAGHYRERIQPIDEYVFIYSVDGGGWYECGGNREYVEGNRYFVLPPGIPHRYGAMENNPWTIYWIHFNGILAKDFFPQTPFSDILKPGVKSRIADRLDIFEEIMMVLEAGYSQESLLYVSSVFHHFLGTLRFLHQYRHADSIDDAMKVELVGAAIHYMEENIGKHLKLNDICGYLGYSSSRFSEIFRKQAGCSPIEYFIRLKINYACRLLEVSDFSVQQISSIIGIDDPYYFSRIFKKHTGCSPTAFRANKRN